MKNPRNIELIDRYVAAVGQLKHLPRSRGSDLQQTFR